MGRKKNEPCLMDMARHLDSQRSNLTELLSRLEEPNSEGARRKLRRGIPLGLQKRLIIRAHGRCENCGTDLLNIKYDFHHKNRDSNDNRESNLMVLCKKCHIRLTGPRPRQPIRYY